MHLLVLSINCWNLNLLGDMLESVSYTHLDSQDVTIQSRNTGHYWYLHCAGYPTEEALVIFHKHRFKDGYHQHGHARSLRQAIKSIVRHDDYQLNVRKCV